MISVNCILCLSYLFETCIIPRWYIFDNHLALFKKFAIAIKDSQKHSWCQIHHLPLLFCILFSSFLSKYIHFSDTSQNSLLRISIISYRILFVLGNSRSIHNCSIYCFVMFKLKETSTQGFKLRYWQFIHKYHLGMIKKLLMLQ